MLHKDRNKLPTSGRKLEIDKYATFVLKWAFSPSGKLPMISFKSLLYQSFEYCRASSTNPNMYFVIVIVLSELVISHP